MGDIKVEGTQSYIPQFQALERKYDELERELSTGSGSSEKVLITAYNIASVLSHNQKKTENEIARAAEEASKRTNQRQVATYKGWKYFLLSLSEVTGYGAAGSLPHTRLLPGSQDDANRKFYAKTGGFICQSISTGKGWEHNRLEAQRTEHNSEQGSLDGQSRRLRDSASQSGQLEQERLQSADQVAQSKFRAMQTIVSGN